jgi:predicted Fe-Mo cluster-binding NifX family protein
MMHIAIATWRNRISPVFDTARTLLIIRLEDNTEQLRFEIRLPGQLPALRILRMQEHNVEVLICGAISKKLLGLCERAGIKTIPWISGQLDKVLESYLAKNLPNPDLSMPGCCGQRRVRKRRRTRRQRGPRSNRPKIERSKS